MMTAEDKIAVAKDVIAQISARNYKATNMVFIAVNLCEPASKNIVDLQDAINLPMKVCEVCARGALVLSYARLFDNIPVQFGDDRSRIGWSGSYDNALTDAFGFDNTRLIERAFERWLPLGGRSEDRQDRLAYQFGAKFNDPSSRMVAIMQNIIDNNGVFNP